MRVPSNYDPESTSFEPKEGISDLNNCCHPTLKLKIDGFDNIRLFKLDGEVKAEEKVKNF